VFLSQKLLTDFGTVLHSHSLRVLHFYQIFRQAEHAKKE